MPPEWEELVLQAGISKEEIQARPKEIISCIETQTKFNESEDGNICDFEDLPDISSFTLGTFLTLVIYC